MGGGGIFSKNIAIYKIKVPLRAFHHPMVKFDLGNPNCK